MNLDFATSDLNEYLALSDVIDFDDRNIQFLANQLSAQTKDDVEIAQKAYEFVRDKIPHSFDINGKYVTCQASRVLQHQEGICFAKSHLLAAILRYLKIPTVFCYQRLVFRDEQPDRFILHGLNAIYLNSLNRWVRVDARGNKNGVDAKFCLDKELLAYPVRTNFAEIDYLTIYSQPNYRVVAALNNSNNFEELIDNIPSEL